MLRKWLTEGIEAYGVRFVGCGLLVAGYLAVFGAGNALGVVHGDPVPHLEEGRARAGIQYSVTSRPILFYGYYTETYKAEFSRTGVTVDYGVTSQSMLKLYVGNTSIKIPEVSSKSYSGSEYGFGYHQAIGGDDSSRMGVMLSYHRAEGSAEGTKVGFDLVDAAFGVSAALGSEMAGYAAVDYSAFWGNARNGDTIDFEGESRMGAFAGVEFNPNDQLMVGAEIHLLADSGFGLTAKYLF
ncbi:MAG: hypothetical protein OEW12_05735 [Deltaproteobacteria bacterium]|nr:hypothetical protein [Deltaproteobacteria bacterium]